MKLTITEFRPRSLISASLAAFLLVLPPAAFAQTDTNSEIGALNLDEWETLATRAEEAVEAGAARDSALLALRLQLSESQERALDAQTGLQDDIERINAQIEALGPPADSGVAEDPTVVERRRELNSRLETVSGPYRVAEEINQRAEGLIDQIDSIVRLRQRERLYRLNPSPVNPANWGGAIDQALEFFGNVAKEIEDAWASDAQRKFAQQSVPRTAMFLVLGLLLLTRFRTWTHEVADEIRAHLGKRAVDFGGSLTSMITMFVFPVAGIFALLAAVESTGMLFLASKALVVALAWAAVSVFTARWIGKKVFAPGAAGIIPSRKGEAWSAAARRTIFLIGWAFAGNSVLLAIVSDVDDLDDSKSIIVFPVIVVSAFLLFRLSRLLAAHVAESENPDVEHTILDNLLTALAWGGTAIAVASPVLAAIGFGAAADFLLLPYISSMGLFGIYLVIHRILYGVFEQVAVLAGIETESTRHGLNSVMAGALLLVLFLPVLALIWGASVADLSQAWIRAQDGFEFGGQRITVGTVLTLILVFLAAYFVTRIAQALLRRSILPNTKLSMGAQKAVATGTGYAGIFIATLLAVSIAGIDLTNLAIVAGALSVGIGFGLQAIVSNFVSGIILLIERPITEGDWVEAGGVSGTVRKISVRATHIETFDRARVVVPNSDLISGQVTNWTLGNRLGRVRIPIGVAYGTDTEKVKSILFEIASSHPVVMQDPAPSVMFMGFGADALEFEVRAILNDVNFILTARSEINFAISERFEQEGISIPFPQRDIWIKNPEALVPTKS